MEKSVLTKDDILSVLRLEKVVLHKQFSVKNIGIFGSFARNDANSESDIDFLVDFEEGNLDYYSIVRDLHDFLGGKFHREVDIAIRKSLKPFFRDAILKQAVYA
jgi:predicted nucleotidyltransferase